MMKTMIMGMGILILAFVNVNDVDAHDYVYVYAPHQHVHSQRIEFERFLPAEVKTRRLDANLFRLDLGQLEQDKKHQLMKRWKDVSENDWAHNNDIEASLQEVKKERILTLDKWKRHRLRMSKMLGMPVPYGYPR